jgi:hypothetical protein
MEVIDGPKNFLLPDGSLCEFRLRIGGSVPLTTSQGSLLLGAHVVIGARNPF